MSDEKLAFLTATLCVYLSGCAEESRIDERECWTATLVQSNARCGLISVPASYDDATGPHRQVAFAVKPPIAVDSDIAEVPAVFLIGGPGLSGTYFSEIDGYDPDDLNFLNEDRELILVDYRGLGQSEPVLDCERSETLEDCSIALNESGLAPELRAATFARDIDLLLETLGHESVVLYGESWGTRLALTMMRDVAGRISHVVLDGVFPPEIGLRDDPESALAGLDTIASACENSAECTSKLGNVREKIMQLGERWIDRDDTGRLFAGIAAVGHFPTAPLLVHELWSQNPDSAADTAAQIYQWTNEEYDDSPIDRAESFLMARGVICAEEAGLVDEHGPLDASPYGFSGPTLENILSHTFGAPMSPEQAIAMCANLDVDAAPKLEVLPVVSDIPTLVLSGGMDMDTSFVWGSLAASRLENSEHLVFPFPGHVTALGNDCSRSIAAQFVSNPTIELDTTCHAESLALSRDLVLSSPDVLAEVRQLIPDTLSIQ